MSGYYPRAIGEDAPLSAKDEATRKRRKTVRTRLGREESEKPFQTRRHLSNRSRISGTNSITQLKPSWQKTMSSKDSTKIRTNYNKPYNESNSKCDEWGPNCGEEVPRINSIVGPMLREKGANVTNGD